MVHKFFYSKTGRRTFIASLVTACGLLVRDHAEDLKDAVRQWSRGAKPDCPRCLRAMAADAIGGRST